MTLTIVHLYPDLLRTYGDRGNVMALTRRARWRDIDVDLVEVTRGESLPGAAGIVFMGGGSDRVQRIIGSDLSARCAQLGDLAAAGTVVVGVCGGYQMLGTGYRLPDGEILEGLGLLDVFTEAGPTRIIGRLAATVDRPGLRTELIGFENHGGRTTLGPAATALARTARGRGNNGEDGTEGAVQGTILGTYLHGPVLPLNPALTDWIIATALGRDALTPIDDTAEERARARWPRSRG